MSEENVQLTEHEKQMIAVAEGGDPNAPDDNKGGEPRLPSEGDLPLDQMKPEDMSKEQLLEFIKMAQEEETEDEGEEDGEEETDDSGDDEELSEEERKLQEAEDKLREVAAFEEAGGKEAYQELVAWGSENLDENEIGIFNQAVTQGEPEVTKFAVRAVNALRQVKNYETFGQQGQMTDGQGTAMMEGLTGYESQAEMQRDMQDPRYHTDPAFQQKVMMKLSVTSAF